MKKMFKQVTVIMMLGLVLSQARGVESRKISFPFWMSLFEETTQQVESHEIGMSLTEGTSSVMESRKIAFPFWM